MRLNTKTGARTEGMAWHHVSETLFSFPDLRIRDKVIALLIDTRHDFRLQGERIVRVTIEPNHVPILIAQVSSALSRAELKKINFVSARHVESESNCQVIQLLTLDHVIRDPAKYKSLVSGPAWGLQPKAAGAGLA